jgi:lambda family phage portal protein
MDALTRLLSRIAPSWAASRIVAQGRLIAAQRYYDAIQASSYRPRRGGGQSADAVMDRAKGRMREYARFLDENHDLAIGVLDDLVTNIVGSGVGVEPMARTRGGDPATDLNRQLVDLWRTWWDRPDVTGEIPGPELERLLCRTWLRDGEVFAQHVVNRAGMRPAPLPYLIEPLESDFVPFDLTTDTIIHGIQKNAWGQPVGYHVYRVHPGEVRTGARLDTKFVPAAQMLHLKFTRRLHQTRGVSILHGVLTRLDDIRDYEESERIAARVAAALTAYIKRNGDFDTETTVDGTRAFEMSPGMVFDNLLPGEDVGVIKSDRPSANLEGFRNSQLRAVAAGTCSRFSSIAKNYNGTYSAQRQELTEGSLGYRRLFSLMRDAFYLPVWQRFVDTAALSGAIRIPASVDRASLYRPEIRPPATPWIDPRREIEAWALSVENGFKSRWQVIRDMGGDPSAVDAQLAADEFDIRPEPAPANTPPPAESAAPPAEPDADDEDADENADEDLAA